MEAVLSLALLRNLAINIVSRSISEDTRGNCFDGRGLSPWSFLGLFSLVGELIRFAITRIATNRALSRGAVEGVAEGRDILSDLRQLRAGFEGSDGADRQVDKKMDIMRTCVEKVEGAVYRMIVRGRERLKG